jgi:D-3-phosphoglycerate dehydrogenase
MVRVLIADAVSPGAAALIRARGIEVDERSDLGPDSLVACIGGYDGIVVRSATKLTAETMEAAVALKVIGRAGVDVDNIDVAAATARGIVVMNAPEATTTATAELTIGLLLAAARQVAAADRGLRAGKWEKGRLLGVELSAKTLGIVGLGRIGTAVAGLAHGLKMRVLATDPYVARTRMEEHGVEKVSLEGLLKRSDFITLHAPLTDETRGMIDASALRKTREGVRIVNCARGGLIVEPDLAAAIRQGHVAAAGLDVFAKEPVLDNPLFALETVIATPHIGAGTVEGQERLATAIAGQVADYLLSGKLVNVVNASATGGVAVAES